MLATILQVHRQKIVMKKSWIVLAAAFWLSACGGSDQGGTVNDGIHTVDRDGAIQDTTRLDPRTDTTLGENRTDVSRRDASINKDTGKSKLSQPGGQRTDSVQAQIKQ